MKAAVPREIEPLEGSVVQVPECCGPLVRQGAGMRGGFSDEQ